MLTKQQKIEVLQECLIDFKNNSHITVVRYLCPSIIFHVRRLYNINLDKGTMLKMFGMDKYKPVIVFSTINGAWFPNTQQGFEKRIELLQKMIINLKTKTN